MSFTFNYTLRQLNIIVLFAYSYAVLIGRYKNGVKKLQTKKNGNLRMLLYGSFHFFFFIEGQYEIERRREYNIMHKIKKMVKRGLSVNEEKQGEREKTKPDNHSLSLLSADILVL